MTRIRTLVKTFKVNEEEAEMLKSISEKEDMSEAHVVRRLIKNAFYSGASIIDGQPRQIGTGIGKNMRPGELQHRIAADSLLKRQRDMEHEDRLISKQAITYARNVAIKEGRHEEAEKLTEELKAYEGI